MTGIYIAIPTYDRKIDMEIVSGVLGLVGQYQDDHTFCFDSIAGSIIANARNYLVKRFLESGLEWLYFWDADVVIREPKFLEMLLETSQKFDAKIVGGVYRIKSNHKKYAAGNYDPETGSIKNYEMGELKEPQLIDCLATGSMLIHRSVFEEISDPWFEFKEKPNGEVLPEDYNFCLKAKAKGIKVAVDPRFDTFHFGYSFWQHSSK